MLNKSTGNFGENFAKNLLIKNGYKIVTTNFRCKFGEIDLIAIKEEVLVFVEVKTRRSTKFGLPEEAVNPNKLRTIAKVGDLFAMLNPNMPIKKRIDVVSLIMRNGAVMSSKIIKVV